MSLTQTNDLASSGGAPRILTRAVVRASEKLEVSAAILARVLGLSEAKASLLSRQEFLLESSSKPFELGVLFVRLFRSLDAIVGGDDDVARAWLKNDNRALGGAPLEKIQTVAGLVDVIAYLDARRAVL